MSAWTVGRLTYQENNDAYTHILRDGLGHIVHQGSQNSTGKSEADARRLAACWNAFDGVDTDKIEGKTVAEYVCGEAYLTGMRPAAGGMNINLSGTACQMLADSFAGQFKGSGAINHLEVGMTHREIGDFIVTIQRVHGETPCQQKAKAQAESAAARALLADVLATCARTSVNEPLIERIHALLKGGAA